MKKGNMDTKLNHSPECNWPKRNGMTVPNGYFEDFTTKMMAKIPEEPVVIELPKRTMWQRVKPYVYMAALFAGAYLMLDMFNIASGLRNTSGENTIQMQNLLADIVNTNNQTYLDDYIYISDCDVLDALFDEGYEIPEIY